MQDAKPTNAVEAAIRSLHAALTLPDSPFDTEGVTAAEWWPHMRGAREGHQLHFDVDESRLRVGAAKYKLKHPVGRCMQPACGTLRMAAGPHDARQAWQARMLHIASASGCPAGLHDGLGGHGVNLTAGVSHAVPMCACRPSAACCS